MSDLPISEAYPIDLNPADQAEAVRPPHLTLVPTAPEEIAAPEANVGAETPITYLDDWRKAEAARNDPNAFEALYEEFHGFMRLKASAYFIQGGDAQDVAQEAAIGFYKGVRDYDGRGSSLRSFLDLCMSRQIITAVKTATRHKHNVLNQAASFDVVAIQESDAGSDLTIGTLIEDKSPLPEDIVAGREALENLTAMLTSKLSHLERRVLALFIHGMTYEQIAEQLDVTERSVDNALQRAKRRIGRHLEETDKTLMAKPGPILTKEQQLKLEQDQLKALYESWLADTPKTSEDELRLSLTNLKNSPEVREELMREMRGHLAYIALNSEWPSPLMAYQVACNAAMRRAREIPKANPPFRMSLSEILINAALKALKTEIVGAEA